MIPALSPMVRHHREKGTKNVFTMIFALSVCLVLFARFFPFSIEADQLQNLTSGSKNGYTMVGASLGLLAVYPLEKKYVNFETKAVWWVQILKVLLGFALVLAVKEGLRVPLDGLFAGHLIARAVRYFLIVLTAGLLWPMSFRWFSKIGAKK